MFFLKKTIRMQKKLNFCRDFEKRGFEDGVSERSSILCTGLRIFEGN